MLNLILMAFATVATLMLLACLARGRKYRSLVENLKDDEYPLKDFYVVGFYLSTKPMFALRGNLERELKKQSQLYWDNRYAEYYANLAWAQFLSFSMVIIAFALCAAGLAAGIGSVIAIIVGAMALAIAWNLTISKMKEAVAKRRDECEYEFPNMVSKLALLVSTGMVTRQAWYLVAKGKEGPLYDLMKRSCEDMDNGATEIAAIHKFGILSDSSQIKKFTSTMIQSLEKGGGELSTFLLGQTSELWMQKRQLALQKGEQAAGKLIAPIGVMFGGVILIIMSAAMQSFSF